MFPVAPRMMFATQTKSHPKVISQASVLCLSCCPQSTSSKLRECNMKDESFFQDFFLFFFLIFFPGQGSFSGFFFRRRLGGQFSYWCIGVGRVTEKYREFYREMRNIENCIEKCREFSREMRNIQN